MSGRRGRRCRRKPGFPGEDEEAPPPAPVPKAKPKPKGKRGRKKREVKPVEADNLEHSSADEEVPTTARKRRRSGRRAKKPQVKDLTIALGIENAPQRLSKSQKKDVPEEDLHENRYEEEVRRACNLNEVIRLADARQGGSDDEHRVDGEVISGESGLDDDENPGCPNPLPRRSRLGGRKSQAKFGNEDGEEEESNEMCLLIKKAMRRPLILKTESAQRSVDAPPGMQLDEAIFPEGTPNDTTFVMYKQFRKILQMEDEVANDVNMGYANSPSFYCAGISAYNASKGILHKHLCMEHLSWISIAVLGDTKLVTHPNGVLAWIPNFQSKFVSKFPILGEDARPKSGTILDTLLSTATIRASTMLTTHLRKLMSAQINLRRLVDLISEAIEYKRDICTEFTLVHDEISCQNAQFDEASVWGLKPIRLALEPPYFKSADGLMAFPMTPDAEHRANHYSSSFFKRDKQKWTTKDLQQLKLCIKEAIVSKRMSALDNRYQMLLSQIISAYDAEILAEGRADVFGQDRFRRRRGRPKKSELEVSDQYGRIFPATGINVNGHPVKYGVNPKTLAAWRDNEERILKEKSYDELVYMENEVIDWAFVANKMILKSRKHRAAEDCELAWRHEVHPKVNDKRWTVEESRRLNEIYAQLDCDWNGVAAELNKDTDLMFMPGRTPYQCYFRIRNRLHPPKKLVWTPEMDKVVLSKLEEKPANWRLVAASLDDPAATKRQVIERYKKTINPVLRNGAFTRVEDCLLILTIEKLKPFLAREGHFGCLLAYLPWRCETTWRDRANNLFSDWIVPWTLEEDQMLLQLAKTMNRNWQKISEEFTSFKNRKGCLTRYKILNRRLKDERFNNSLDAYHEAYAMTRYNVFQYKHLKEILELLKRVRSKPLPPELSHFPGLVRDREPTEVRLQHMLLTFDKNILESAIGSLTHYMRTRDEYWQNWINKHGKRKRTFDRRTFHADCPQSVASALHIRGLKLKAKDEVENLSAFEAEIYKFYARFCRTKALKPDADRPYIPDAKTLAEWSTVTRLIATPTEQLKDVPLKRKWKALKIDKEMTKIFKKRACNQRRQRSDGAAQADASVVKSGKELGTDEGGFILIPPEATQKRTRQRRPRKTEEQWDPEFVARDVNSEDVAGTEVAVRRSNRQAKPSLTLIEVKQEEDEEDKQLEPSVENMYDEFVFNE